MKKVLYLWLVNFWSKVWQTDSPQKVVYLMSFGNNNEFIEELADACHEKDLQLLVFYRPECLAAARKLAEIGVVTKPFTDGFGFLTGPLKEIMAAKLLICDNYYAFLGGCNFNHHKTRVVQIWHANGAIKAFGWEDPRTKERSFFDKRRFQKVYNQFDDYIVGSEKMGRVFVDSYHVPETRMKVIGYPRTDRLFSSKWQADSRKEIYAAYPELKDKEVLLYAPTYREDEDGNVIFDLPADFDAWAASLPSNIQLVIKLHPHLARQKKQLQKRLGDKVLWLDQFDTDQVMLVADRLITDYSSVIFDYSLLENAQQMIFYLFDEKQYASRIGLQKDFSAWRPGPVAHNASELDEILKNKPVEKAAIENFNQLWNTRNDGQAGERFLAKYVK